MKNNEYNLRHKTNFLRKTICILILGAFLSSFVFSWYQVETNYTYISDPVASVSHSPISIDGNAALDAFCSGKGTDGLSWDTAHVIEDLEIDAEGVGSVIDIRNTDRFLIIRRCNIINSGDVFDYVGIIYRDSGIFLGSVKNVKITECDVNNNYLGIGLSGAYNISAYNIISDNVISNNRYKGIAIFYASHNTISDNEVTYNSIAGISLKGDSNYNTISGNNASYNDNYGIKLESSESNTISGNYASYNNLYGIALDDKSDNNEVYQNIVCHNELGGINDLGSDNDIHDNDDCTGDATDGVIPGYPFVWMLGFILFGLTVSLYVVLKRRKNNP